MSRIVVCAALFATSCLLMVQRTEPVVAQDKKDKKDAPKDNTAMLEKQVAALKQDLNLAVTQINVHKGNLTIAEKQVTELKAANNKLQADNNQLTAALKKERADDKDEKAIKELKTTIDGFRKAGLVHVVILKLKPDSEATEPQSVIDDTYSQLSKIKTVRGVWAGKPTATEKGTPDAASDYTVALVFLFADAAGLQAYLKDPIHDKFAEKHLKKWETPLVYDFEPKKAAP
jgi:hypothetical protein